MTHRVITMRGVPRLWLKYISVVVVIHTSHWVGVEYYFGFDSAYLLWLRVTVVIVFSVYHRTVSVVLKQYHGGL